MDENLEPTVAAVELDANESKFVGFGYLITGFAFLLTGAAWIFFGFEIAIDYFKEKAPEWLNRPLNQTPEWVGAAWLSITVMVPSGIFFLLSAYFIRRVDYLNRSMIYAANLQDLSKARAALQQGLASLDKIERDFKIKVASFDKLQKQIDELSSLRQLNVVQAQKMLNAIAYASRYKTWAGHVASFLLGVITSLLGAFIWDVVAK